jgi:RNA polymerase sigma factor (sigma-70 family)
LNIPISDEELILDCIKGRSSAQHALYKRYGPQTFGICRRYTSDQMEAEDLHQIGWMRVFDKISTFRNEGPFGGWMRRLFVSVCLTAYQKRKKQMQWLSFGTEDEVLRTVTDPNPPSDFLELEKLAQLISKLPEGARLVFNLFAVEGMNHKEIAESLGISEETSRQQLRRARIQLAGQLPEKKSEKTQENNSQLRISNTLNNKTLVL